MSAAQRELGETCNGQSGVPLARRAEVVLCRDIPAEGWPLERPSLQLPLLGHFD